MTHRQETIETLGLYSNSWPNFKPLNQRFEEESETIERFDSFVRGTPDCFERSHLAGHVTGSALVVSRNLDQVLLTHHRKLNKWLQLGGHADGDPIVHTTAMREAEEESGLTDLRFLSWEPIILGRPSASPQPFDLDHHEIPAHKGVPAHIHYDFRFLIVADHNDQFIISDESNDLKWFTIEEAMLASSERSMHRQFKKLLWIASQINPNTEP